MKLYPKRLPDFDPLFRRKIKIVFRRNIKSVIPSVEITYNTVSTVFTRAMRVCFQTVAEGFITEFDLPDLRPSEEEPLIACKAINNRRFFTIQRPFISVISHLNARQIANVFTQSEAPIDVFAGERFKRSILSHKSI